MGVLIALVRWIVSLALLLLAALFGYVGFYAVHGNMYLVGGAASLLLAALVVNPLTIGLFGLRGRPGLAWLAALTLFGAGAGVGGYGALLYLDNGVTVEEAEQRRTQDVAYAVGDVMTAVGAQDVAGPVADVSAITVLSQRLATAPGVGECHIGLLRLLAYHVAVRAKDNTDEARAALRAAARYRLTEDGQDLGEHPLPDESIVRAGAAAWFGAAIAALPQEEALPMHIPHSIVERQLRRIDEAAQTEGAFPTIAGSVETRCLAPLDFWR